VQIFIREHANDDLSKLLFSGKEVDGVPMTVIVDQIRSRNKAKLKLPSWYQVDGIVFPPPVSLEQASSEETGRYKANLVNGSNLLDMTGGMGIDTSFFAERFEYVTYVERQVQLVSCFRHNGSLKGLKNIDYIDGDGVDYHEKSDQQFDVIYLDPARRGGDDEKVYAIESCEPDVSAIQTTLSEKAEKVMVKLSPMLDITHTLSQLQHVTEVHVVAVENECKELLFILDKNFSEEPMIKTVNIEKGRTQFFQFHQSTEKQMKARIGAVAEYLYEPNTALLKSGAFKIPTDCFDLWKLDEHTHLYSSNELRDQFPGKIYHVEKIYTANKKAIKNNLKDLKVSVKTRNYPDTVASIRKKFNLKDGNDRYVFFCKVKNEKVVVECTKAPH